MRLAHRAAADEPHHGADRRAVVGDHVAGRERALAQLEAEVREQSQAQAENKRQLGDERAELDALREEVAILRKRCGDCTHGDVEKLRGTFKCHRGSLDFDFKFIRNA